MRRALASLVSALLLSATIISSSAAEARDNEVACILDGCQPVGKPGSDWWCCCKKGGTTNCTDMEDYARQPTVRIPGGSVKPKTFTPLQRMQKAN